MSTRGMKRLRKLKHGYYMNVVMQEGYTALYRVTLMYGYGVCGYVVSERRMSAMQSGSLLVYDEYRDALGKFREIVRCKRKKRKYERAVGIHGVVMCEDRVCGVGERKKKGVDLKKNPAKNF